MALTLKITPRCIFWSRFDVIEKDTLENMFTLLKPEYTHVFSKSECFVYNKLTRQAEAIKDRSLKLENLHLEW